MEMIHSLALVSKSKIGEWTKVWQFASVIRGSVVGNDCVIGSCAIVDGAILGNGCLVGHGASIHPGVVAGNNVFFGPGCVLCNDGFPSTSKEGFDFEALSECAVILVDDGATIGANATILPGVHLHKNSMVAAGSVCRKDVPENCLHLRSGEIIRKPDDWQSRRMRWAR